MGETAKYVYGVASTGAVRRVSTPGVNAEGGAVHTVEEDGLAALVSDVPDGPLTGTKDDVLAHSRVLEEAVATATVLPMRFGVTLPSADAVREELLGRYRDELRHLLTVMDGRVQMRVRVFYQEDAGLRELVAENPAIAELREGLRGKPEDATYYDRIRLGELVSEALDAKRERDGGDVLARLEPFAVDVTTDPAVHEQMVLNASLLVERDRLEEFGDAVERAGRELGARLQVRAVGPLPPFSFVDLPDVSREGSWA